MIKLFILCDYHGYNLGHLDVPEDRSIKELLIEFKKSEYFPAPSGNNELAFFKWLKDFMGFKEVHQPAVLFRIDERDGDAYFYLEETKTSSQLQ